jgi:hypothetical protein
MALPLRAEFPRKAQIPIISSPEGSAITGFTTLLPRELLARREKITTLEQIPLSAIQLDEMAIVDHDHADELRDLIFRPRKQGEKPRGQTTPIAVRAWEQKDDKGNVTLVYDISDGYHRTIAAMEEAKAARLNGDTTPRTITASVMYDCNDEELFDLRIAAVGSVKSVQFPRLIEWMNRSFEGSEWGDQGLTIAQVFGVAANAGKNKNENKRSNLMNISGDDLDRLIDWATGKAKKWGRSIDGVYQTLLAVEDADPALVRQVRSSKGGGKDHSVFITPERLKAVVAVFPGEKNFGLQRHILEYAVARKFSSKETAYLALQAADILTPEMDLATINAKLLNIVMPKDIGLAVRTVRTYQKVNPLQQKIAQLEGELGGVKDELAEMTTRAEEAEEALLTQRRGLSSAYREQIQKLETQLAEARQAQERQKVNQAPAKIVISNQTQRLIEQEAERAKHLVEANKSLVEKIKKLESGELKSTGWWNGIDADDLEIRCIQAVLSGDKKMKDAARDMGISVQELVQYAFNAVNARFKHEQAYGRIIVEQ